MSSLKKKDGASTYTSDSTNPNFRPTPVMAGVATLKVNIDQQLAVSLLPDGDRWDLRGRLDKIKWGHYEALADGIARTIAVQLRLLKKDVSTDGSILVGDGVAEPRLIVEVPLEHKDAVATEKVWAAIQYVIDLVTGAATLEEDAGASGFNAKAVAANDPITGVDDLDPTDRLNTMGPPAGAEPGLAIAAGDGLFDAATKNRLQSVARSVLSKVGGATLELPCRIEVDGLSCPPLEISGRCADKPVPRSSGPKQETFDCYVDGFIRSRHTVYLIDVAGNGLAREVAMASHWERRVAVYASNRYRGRKCTATVAVERKGDKVVRELIDLR